MKTRMYSVLIGLLETSLQAKNIEEAAVLAADAAKWSGNLHSIDHELQILSHLRNGGEEAGKDCVVRLLDDFIHFGPDGKHQCIVTELLGPDLSSDIEELYPTEIFPAAISRAIIKQITYAIQFLHRNNIIHGDLHVGNILVTSPKLSSFGQHDVIRYYGEVYKYLVKHGVDGVGEPPHVPQYLVDSPDTAPLLQLCLSNPVDVRIKICDFSESSIITAKNRPKRMNMPFIYRAPEVILRNPLVPALSADIWALAVLFYFIVSGHATIFSPGQFGRLSEDEVLRNIVLRLGKLPEPIWSAWDKWGEFFDETGRPLAESKDDKRLVRFNNRIMNEEERVIFEDMIRTMVVLEPTKRGTIDDVMKSKWFAHYCEGGVL